MTPMPSAPVEEYPAAIWGHKSRPVFAGQNESRNLAEIIAGHIDGNSRVVASTNTGSAVNDWAFKRAGHLVLGNDTRRRSALRFECVVQNDGTILTEDEVDAALRPAPSGPFSRHFVNVLGEQNAALFDSIAANLRHVADGIRRRLLIDAALHAYEQALDIPHNHWRRDRSGMLKNSGVTRLDLGPVVRRWLLCELPRFLFGNGHQHRAWNLDAVAAAAAFWPRPDVTYSDFPYPGTGGADYHGDWAVQEQFLALFEGGHVERPWTEPVARPKHRFERANTYVNGVGQMLLRLPDVRQVMVSINDRSTVSPEQVGLLMAAMGRIVDIHRYPTSLPSCTPGAPRVVNECLVIGRLPSRRTAFIPAPAATRTLKAIPGIARRCTAVAVGGKVAAVTGAQERAPAEKS